jgi:hypothetical protein
MKINHLLVGTIHLPPFFRALEVEAQNVGIGVSTPLSKLTVNGSLAIGADYNAAAPLEVSPASAMLLLTVTSSP